MNNFLWRSRGFESDSTTPSKKSMAIGYLFILVAMFLFISGCGKESINESDLMKLHNQINKNASISCSAKNMNFQSVDLKNFNEFDYYCFTNSPFKIYKHEGVLN